MSVIYSMVSINGGPPVRAELAFETDMIDVSSISATKPDLRWEYYDSAGHYHAYDDDGTLPTLKMHELSAPCGCEDCARGIDPVDDDDEVHVSFSTFEYRCVACAEVVASPGRVPDNPHRMIPGLSYWTLVAYTFVNDERVSFRFEAGHRVVFGFAQPVRSTSSFDGRGRTELTCWPVGQRKVVEAA